jgi:hypothetical protein
VAKIRVLPTYDEMFFGFFTPKYCPFQEETNI